MSLLEWQQGCIVAGSLALIRKQKKPLQCQVNDQHLQRPPGLFHRCQGHSTTKETNQETITILLDPPTVRYDAHQPDAMRAGATEHQRIACGRVVRL